MRALSRFLIVVVLVLAAVPVPAVGGVRRGRVAATCSVRADGRRLGPSYVTSLTVTSTSCAAGKKLVRAYYRCRIAHGGPKGHCVTRVLGYRCTEKRVGISIQFDATVNCRRGKMRVRHTYTQDT